MTAETEALDLARAAILTSCCDGDICDRSEPLRQDTHGCYATPDGYCVRLRALDAIAAVLRPPTPGQEDTDAS